MLPSALPVLSSLPLGGIVGIVVACAAVVIAAVALIWAFPIRRHGYRTQLRNLKQSRNDCEERLKTQVESRIKRLARIGEKSEDHRLKASECQALETEIRRSELAQADSSLAEVESRIERRQFRKLSRYLAATSDDVRKLSEAVQSLDKKLKSYLELDDSLHAQIATVKEKLLSFKEFNADHADALGRIQPVLDFLYQGLNDQFERFDVFLNEAGYESASTQLKGLNVLIDALISYENDLLKIISEAFTALPQHLKDLYVRYQELLAEGIPLYHLNVDSEVEEMANRVMSIRKSLASLDIGHDVEEIDSLEDRIRAMKESFRAEEDAKAELESRDDRFDSRVFDLQERAVTLRAKHSVQSRKFVIQDSWNQWLSGLKNRLDELISSHTIYMELDAASVRPPYTQLLSHAEDLARDIEDLEREMDRFDEYLASLDKDFGALKAGIGDDSEGAERTLCSILQMGVPTYAQAAYGKLDEILSQLDEVYDLSRSVPCDLAKTQELFGRVDRSYQELLSSIQSDLSSYQQAVGLIMRLNTYRSDYDLNVNGMRFDQGLREFDSGRFQAAAEILQRTEDYLRTSISSQVDFDRVQAVPASSGE